MAESEYYTNNSGAAVMGWPGVAVLYRARAANVEPDAWVLDSNGVRHPLWLKTGLDAISSRWEPTAREPDDVIT